MPEILGSVKPPRGSAGQGKLGIVIDAANLMGACRERGGRPDYPAILSELSDGQPFIGTVCVNVRHETPGIKRFMDMVRRQGLLVVPCTPVMVAGTMKNCDDVAFSVEAVVLAYRTDVREIVLVTGDSDCRPAVRPIRALRKRITVAAFNTSISAVLYAQANAFISLTDAHVIPSAAVR